MNGIKLQGQIESFDQYVVLLKNSVTQMVYKHAISTVVPSRPISLGARRNPSTRRCRPDPQAAVIVCLDFGDDGYEESVAEIVRLVESAGVRAPPRGATASASVPTRSSTPAAARSRRSAPPPTS